jgi:predicted metalloprotease with PDZ domain
MKKISILLGCFFAIYTAFAQDTVYRYNIDITKITDRKLYVELTPPKLFENQVIFSLPKIVPGTYSIYDFGRFIEDFKALDASGNQLSVTHIDTNSWSISNSGRLAKISYKVNDTFHPKKRNNPIFEPAGTDFEPDTCYLLNLHTILGYFRNHTKEPYELNITHQANFFGSTSLIDVDPNSTKDRYEINNYNQAVDNPILYTRPDTAHITIGESDILISVYSPSQKAIAKRLAIQIDTLLQDQAKYLGGKLPVKKYSFLIYLSNHDGITGGFGALEHSYGSMYYLIDGDLSQLAPTVRDVASHEFFHIVTPLNIHSVEIANFDFDHPKMSEHLWLYEGSTEYHAHTMQVRYGLITRDKYLDVIKQKMTEAMFGFNDSLSFTEMSKGCLDTFKDQYGNVYAKGMLISLCLDLELLHLSHAKYGIMDLIRDLSKSYGKDRTFEDNELIPKIITLTYPEIKKFFDSYVIGGKALPFEEVLAYAGVDFTRIKKVKDFSFGQCDLGYNPTTSRMMVTGTKNLNDFGRVLGYNLGDEIIKINGKNLSLIDFRLFPQNWLNNVKEGDHLKIVVLRKTSVGKTVKKILKAKVFKSDVRFYNSLEFSSKPSAEQTHIRKAWLEGTR